MSEANLKAVMRSIDDNIRKRASKRQANADKVAKEMPTYLGRSTRNLSNNQLCKIGIANGIIKTEQRKR